MITRSQITFALAIAAIAWGTALYFQGAPLSWHYAAPFSIVVGVLAIVSLAMEHVLWRFRIFQGWLFNRPHLIGTWKVTIQSEWVNPETGLRIGPIVAYAGISQTASKLEIHVLTPESESCLLAHAIKPSTCGSRFEISIVYANTPSVMLRGVRSERHIGAATITTHGPKKYKPESMEAEYWTDRRTVGHMQLDSRTKTVFSRYVDAHSHFSSLG